MKIILTNLELYYRQCLIYKKYNFRLSNSESKDLDRFTDIIRANPLAFWSPEYASYVIPSKEKL